MADPLQVFSLDDVLAMVEDEDWTEQMQESTRKMKLLKLHF